MRSVWVKVGVALLLLVMLSTACSAIRWFKKPTYTKTDVVKKSVLVFPFDLAPEVVVSEAAPKIVGVTVKDELQQTGKYRVLVFSTKLAPIQRAIEVDKTFASTKQVEPPYAEDKVKALQIAAVTGVDFAIMGVIESYTFDATAKSVNILLSAEMVEVKTGKTVAAYTVTGKSTAANEIADENELSRQAIIEGISKLNLDKKSETDSASEKTD